MIDHKLTQFFVTVVASDGQNHPFLIHREIEAAIRLGREHEVTVHAQYLHVT